MAVRAATWVAYCQDRHRNSSRPTIITSWRQCSSNNNSTITRMLQLPLLRFTPPTAPHHRRLTTIMCSCYRHIFSSSITITTTRVHWLLLGCRKPPPLTVTSNIIIIPVTWRINSSRRP